MFMKSLIFSTTLLALTCSANAASFSFTGTLAGDDEVQLFNFSVGAISSVTLRTYSYAGGAQNNGNAVTAGGFDPILALFDSAGALIDQNDDGIGVPSDPVTGRTFDTLLTATLGSGNYTVAVSQFDNFAIGPNLSDGFALAGDPFFTGPRNGCSNGQFCDADGNNRTSNWAFDVLNVDDAVVVDPNPVPIPAAFPFLAGSLALMGFFGWRRNGTRR